MRTDLRTLFCALASMASVLPAAAESSPWWAGASLQWQRDSNIYRLPDSVDALPSGRQRSDSILTTSLVAGLDQPISRQRLRADVSLRSNRFADNGALDNNGYGLRLAWDGATVGRVSGSLSVQADRSLVRFEASSAAGGQLERNIADTRQADATLRIGLVTKLSGEIGYTHQQAQYSAAAFDSREYRQGVLRAGLRYAPSDLLGLSLVLRGTEGRYPRFIPVIGGGFLADDYNGRNVDLLAQVAPSGASQLDARVSVGRTRYDQLTARDLSGVTGQIGWTWRPSGKLRLETRWLRDRGQDSEPADFVASGRIVDTSRVSDSLSLALNYAWTAKVSLSAAGRTTRRELVDTRPLGAAGTQVRSGSDHTDSWQLAARWTPTRAITLGCDVGRERRSADGPLSSDYAVTTAGCFGQMLLQ